MIPQLVVVVLSTLHLGVAFRTGLVPSRHAKVVAFSQRSYATVGLPALVHRRQWLLKSTENSNEDATSIGKLQNRRRRRKQQSPLGNVVASQTNEVEEDEDDDDDDEELNSSLTPSIELKPRDSAGVALEVKDVRAVVGLIPQDNVNTPQREGQQRRPSISSTRSTSSSSSSSSSTSSGLNTADSLERMLADARQMQLQEDESEDDDKESEGVNIPTTIRSILSTIVTIDFFVIIGFLGWFLAGVFASSVLKNDDIQIAFNSKSRSKSRRKRFAVVASRLMIFRI